MLTNNDILKKLRIAYSLTTSEVAGMLRHAGLSLSNSEINAFFRPADDKKNRFRHVSNETLTAFLQELINSRSIESQEYAVLREMLENKATGNVIDEDKGEWLNQLIDRKRG